ncbi:hypothetical protein A3Q56_04418 [Intoshia linei]|uniref:Uncharacterized protein n=1 Tax=Intoshia linei TaxID=1819745 RepID=A0A177B296_9BILA|nr:hypothetical protein A3Q56_04418 [Intoshia linei]
MFYGLTINYGLNFPTKIETSEIMKDSSCLSPMWSRIDGNVALTLEICRFLRPLLRVTNSKKEQVSLITYHIIQEYPE